MSEKPARTYHCSTRLPLAAAVTAWRRPEGVALTAAGVQPVRTSAGCACRRHEEAPEGGDVEGYRHVDLGRGSGAVVEVDDRRASGVGAGQFDAYRGPDGL